MIDNLYSQVLFYRCFFRHGALLRALLELQLSNLIVGRTAHEDFSYFYT